MATLMEKESLLNGVSQNIAFLSNVFEVIYKSQNEELKKEIYELVSYRDYLHSTGYELVDFQEGVLLFQQVRKKYMQDLKALGYPVTN
ncbi:hypothetical protein GKK49_13510 [Escherichia coli]|uniref:Uncharacterized protein n=1 Tax=Escherichia coli TaxID=562 RepID=A0A8S7EI94_ECOLX|nr:MULTISPECIES: hypothetical protein [unclassified Escherichia]EFB3615413.1 hypothetical protein [Escherichia coli]EFB3636004.1 hypothetical protein [Escherichia coli]EFB5254318.1 hypothetical protein [Escherichia coli]EFH7452407.1 hypothetical protein [Escherichia coli]RZM90140.1 hypothetical protein D9742_03545 [Escherichia sp. E1V33]